LAWVRFNLPLLECPVPSDHSTARRTLARRIERFLREQGAMPTPTLTGWQADQVLAAIELLEADRFAEGEHVIMKAERPDLWDAPSYLPSHLQNVPQLLDRLQQVVEGR
jgi:hypothetical protein